MLIADENNNSSLDLNKSVYKNFKGKGDSEYENT